MTETQASPPKAPSAARAVVGLLVNLIVLPGLGTIFSGDLKRRRIGWIQMGLGLMSFILAMSATSGWLPGVTKPDDVRQWVSTFMLALGFWAVITSLFTIYDAWKADR